MQLMSRYDKRNNHRKRNMTGAALAVVLLAAALTGCGSSHSADFSTMAVTEEAYDASYAGSGLVLSDGVTVSDEAYYEEGDTYTQETAGEEGAESAGQTSEEAAADRKLIKTVNVSAETEEFDSLLPELEAQVTALGGYMEEMSVYNRNYSYTYDSGTKYLRYASMTARIPKDNLDQFLSKVGEASNIVSRSESVSDVTLQYVDLESHKKALLTEQERLLELMEQAETVEDIISIESRLSEVRYQIESMESQLRTYDNKIDYSTVYLSIEEVERYTPSEDSSVGERIQNGFLESLAGVGNGIANFAIWFVIHIPYLVVWAVIFAVIVFVFCKVRKRIINRRAKCRTGKTAVQVYPYVPSQFADRQQGASGSQFSDQNTGGQEIRQEVQQNMQQDTQQKE